MSQSGQSRYIFKLYVTGRTPRSERAIENLNRICERVLPDQYELAVIDVLEQPEVAERDRILATPLLVREVPPPARRVLGDLSDVDQVLWGLDVRRPDSDELGQDDPGQSNRQGVEES